MRERRPPGGYSRRRRQRPGRGGTGILTAAAPLLEVIGQVALDLGDAVGAVVGPAAVGLPAQVAGARRHAVRVEAGELVEADGMGGVGGAEDVSAVPAVVAAAEEAKGGAAGGRVAGGGRSVGLSVSQYGCFSFPRSFNSLLWCGVPSSGLAWAGR